MPQQRHCKGGFALSTSRRDSSNSNPRFLALCLAAATNIIKRNPGPFRYSLSRHATSDARVYSRAWSMFASRLILALALSSGPNFCQRFLASAWTFSGFLSLQRGLFSRFISGCAFWYALVSSSRLSRLAWYHCAEYSRAVSRWASLYRWKYA